MTSILISIDVESVGGSLEHNWMPNFGCVAAEQDGTILGDFSVNLTQPPGTVSDPKTLEWFKSQAGLWESITKDAVDPQEGMQQFRTWFEGITKGRKVLFVAYPTIYDGSWLYHYCFKYLGAKGPFYSFLDIRSYASGKLGISYEEASKQKALAKFCPSKDEFPHTHTGLDDAREQLQLYLNIAKQ